MRSPSQHKIAGPLLSQSTGKEAVFHKHTLVIGYGNIDRQDDGVAWHVLVQIAAAAGRVEIDPFETPLVECNAYLTLLFALQLTPEMAELVKDYDRVCFVDAHTGAVDEPVHVEQIKAVYAPSPFTHHLTPSACLSLAESLYNRHPEGLLVSIRGNEFEFSQDLSPDTVVHAEDAVNQILRWINDG